MKIAGKNKEKWEAVKKQGIMNAVFRVITDRGVAGLTMDRIAQEAGIAKGTLYLYFKTKTELLDAAIEYSMAPHLEELNSLLDSDLSPARKLEYAVVRHLRYLEEHKDFYRALLYERMEGPANHCCAQDDLHEKFLLRIGQVIDDGIRAGLFKSMDSQKVAAVFMEGTFAVIGRRMFGISPTPVEEDSRMLVELFFNGLSVKEFGL